jgi:hypothetical protein
MQVMKGVFFLADDVDDNADEEDEVVCDQESEDRDGTSNTQYR